MPRRGRVPVLATVALIVAGCTAGSSSELNAGDPLAVSESAAPSPSTGQDPDRRLTFAFVTHGAAGDPFWDVVKTGAEAAGETNDVEIDYQSASEPGAQAQLIDAATGSGVDGLVVSMADPDALRESIGAAVAAGIPVVTINAGEERSAEFGALTHVGQSETAAGEGAGARLRDAGVSKLLCVVHATGDLALDDRCTGAAQGLGLEDTDDEQESVRNLAVNANNLTQAQITIATELRSDPDIDGVLALSPAVGVVAAEAIDAAGSRATLATFDVNDEVLQLVRDGEIFLAVDQQQYLQGYLPVVFLSLFVRNGNVVGGGLPVATGPRYITRENVDTAGNLAFDGTR